MIILRVFFLLNNFFVLNCFLVQFRLIFVFLFLLLFSLYSDVVVFFQPHCLEMGL